MNERTDVVEQLRKVGFDKIIVLNREEAFKALVSSVGAVALLAVPQEKLGQEISIGIMVGIGGKTSIVQFPPIQGHIPD